MAMTEPRFGNAKYSTIRRDFKALREHIRAHDSFKTEEAWEKCERWIEALVHPPADQIDPIKAQDSLWAGLRAGSLQVDDEYIRSTVHYATRDLLALYRKSQEATK